MKEAYGGIYYLKINNKYYVGKDSKATLNKRKKEHLNLLKKNEHYNKKLQEAFNEFGEDGLEYGVITSSKEYSLKDLEELEIRYISEYKAYEDGYNLTHGGYGMSGYKLTSEQLQLRSDRAYGEKNVNSKLTNKQFFDIVEMLRGGKENNEIALIYGLHERYVSLIRHKKRYKRLWSLVDNDFTPEVSSGNDRAKSVSPDAFKEIVYKIQNGATNASIEREYNLSSGTGSRIRNKKLYKDYWKKYIS